MYDNCVGVRMFILQTFQSVAKAALPLKENQRIPGHAQNFG